MTIRLYNKIRQTPEHLWPEYIKPVLREFLNLQEKCERILKGDEDE